MKLKLKLLAAVIVGIVCMNVALSLTEKQTDELFLLEIEASAQNQGAIVPTFEMAHNKITDCYKCETGDSQCAVSDQCCKSWGGCETTISTTN